jgi:hypothetical protein
VAAGVVVVVVVVVVAEEAEAMVGVPDEDTVKPMQCARTPTNLSLLQYRSTHIHHSDLITLAPLIHPIFAKNATQCWIQGRFLPRFKKLPAA